jgi:hypothetical protein
MKNLAAGLALLATTTAPAASSAQIQLEASAGIIVPGYNTLFDQGDVVGATRAVQIRAAASFEVRAVKHVSGALYAGLQFAIAPDVELENTRILTLVGSAKRYSVSATFGGMTSKIPKTPIRFRGGFSAGIRHYRFTGETGVTFPTDDATSLFGSVSMGGDAELSEKFSIIGDFILPFDLGSETTDATINVVIQAGVAVRL